jgi:hypothetical protein
MGIDNSGWIFVIAHNEMRTRYKNLVFSCNVPVPGAVDVGGVLGNTSGQSGTDGSKPDDKSDADWIARASVRRARVLGGVRWLRGLGRARSPILMSTIKPVKEWYLG